MKRFLKRVMLVLLTVLVLLFIIGVLSGPPEAHEPPVVASDEVLPGQGAAVVSSPPDSDAPSNPKLKLPQSESLPIGQPNDPGNDSAAVATLPDVGGGAESPQEPPVETDVSRLSATVVRVVDGDTIRAMINGNEEVVRLLLIDTPETVHPTKPVEPFGPEASEYVEGLLSEGTTIELERDVSERDRYGRTLFYVYVDGQSVQELLLAQGLARVSVYPPDVKYVDQYREIEAEAKAAGLGIWSIEDYAQETVAPAPPPAPVSNSEPAPLPSSGPTSARGSGYDCPADYPIKGNHSSSGEWIYHRPDGAYYSRTKPEECFKSAKDAEEAGYRASKR